MTKNLGHSLVTKKISKNQTTNINYVETINFTNRNPKILTFLVIKKNFNYLMSKIHNYNC